MFDVVRNNIFFERKFKTIGKILYQPSSPEPKYSSTIRAGSILKVAGTSSFHPYTDGHETERNKGAEGNANGNH
jgi:hypothetical protein